MAKVDKYFIGETNRTFDITDKKRNVQNNIKYMLNRSNIMFEYDGLPDTIPQKELELLLQCNGYAIFTEINGELYVVNGGLGGEGDVYNNPTIATVSIPFLKYNETLNIDKDCVIIHNDTLDMGLIPMYEKYCTLMNENEITMFLADVNKRMQNMLSANDDNTVASAKQYLDDVLNGKIGVIAEQRLFDSLKVNNTTTNGSVTLTELFEYEQYLKASMFNEIGLSANFNMKRERLTSAEVETNTDNLYPLVDDMLNNRRYALEKINEMYGLNITVQFNSSWDYRVNNGEPIETGETFDETETTENDVPETDIVNTEMENETTDKTVTETDTENETETEDETTEETETETKEETETENVDETETETETDNESEDETTDNDEKKND